MTGVSGVGKRVRGSLYVHADAVADLGPDELEAVSRAASLAVDHKWNVARLDGNLIVGLLLYPDFESDAFPRLASAARVDLGTSRIRLTCYGSSSNPLILHRKELLLHPADHRRADWAATTERLERLGLFKDTLRIGRLLAWTQVLAEAGVDHQGRPL